MKPERHKNFQVIHRRVDNRHHMSSARSPYISQNIAVWSVFGLTLSFPTSVSLLVTLKYTLQCIAIPTVYYAVGTLCRAKCYSSRRCLFCTLALQALAPLSAGHHSPIGGGLVSKRGQTVVSLWLWQWSRLESIFPGQVEHMLGCHAVAERNNSRKRNTLNSINDNLVLLNIHKES